MSTATEKPPGQEEDQVSAPFGHFDPKPVPFTPGEIASALRDVGRAVAGKGWDQPMRLLSLFKLGDEIRVVDMQMPPEAFTRYGEHPHRALMDFAHTSIHAALPPPQWCGYALYAEQYTATPELTAEMNSGGNGVEAAREWNQAARDEKGTNGQVELRALYAVDADLRRYLLAERRDTGEIRERNWTEAESKAWTRKMDAEKAGAVSIWTADCYDQPLLGYLSALTSTCAMQRRVGAYRFPAQPPGWFTEVCAEWHE